MQKANGKFRCPRCNASTEALLKITKRILGIPFVITGVHIPILNFWLNQFNFFEELPMIINSASFKKLAEIFLSASPKLMEIKDKVLPLLNEIPDGIEVNQDIGDFAYCPNCGWNRFAFLKSLRDIIREEK
jgi:hypothetical protein